ncbi:site-2 protease family protein [Zafaria sp. Z1313]|uniref:site-2 protease family protein n=1 Tax=unclassified Zafaria TaxID=2828765 RepID=UPI002E785168|nr:site-2 protease family protein [Zafaria sp. J156]MEE1621216.1 site-2 protease family protein [Zafaria sp. J156]
MTQAGAERREGIPLGRVFGVPVSLAWSWFLIAAFIVVVFSPDVARALPGIGPGAYAVALAYAVLLLLSILVHELAHALSARAFGWPGARIVLTLWGGHTQFGSFHATPGKSLVVALAGPAANFVLAGLGYAVQQAAAPTGVAGLLLYILVWANFLVAVFNVLPGLPLDGGRLVESAVWRATGSQERGTVAAGWAGRLIVAGLVAYFVVLPIVEGRALDLQFTIICMLVGGFLWTGANQAIRDARMRERLPRVSAVALMEPASAIQAGASVADVDERVAARPGHVVLVDADGRPEAVVDAASLASVPPHLRSTTPAGTAARALAPGALVRRDAAGRELISHLASLDGSEYVVLDDAGDIVGLLVQSAVVRAVTGR